MIMSSFIILPGIGAGKERGIWRSGIHSWRDFLEVESVHGISAAAKLRYDAQLRYASRRLHEQDASFFADKPEPWRLYSHFRDDAVFLDIETTGLGRNARLTVVGLFDRLSSKSMIAGINLDITALRRELSRYCLIVTYNGSSFDLPFLRARYPDLLPCVPHIDLRPLCSRLGLTGGLKSVEKQLGITRGHLVERLAGGDALTLWRMYRGSGDEHYLNLLVEYNEEDTVNLRAVADNVTGRLEQEIRQEFRNKSPESAEGITA